MTFVANKLYYKIREVCEIVGVEAHVLRFWETEFPALSPPKSKSGQRTYRPKDIELLLRIRKLLYEEGFTIAGARKHLNAEKTTEKVNTEKPAEEVSAEKNEALVTEKPSEPAETAQPADRLDKLKAELQNILTLLDRE